MCSFSPSPSAPPDAAARIRFHRIGLSSDLVSPGDVRLIEAPAGVLFHDPVWLPTLEKIVFTRSPPPGDAFRNELASVAIDGSGLEPLQLPDEPGYFGTYLSSWAAFEDWLRRRGLA